jgi:hypothetical protein
MMRFNSPPGWPRPPFGWTPAPDWQPDPTWPPAPHGWPLWVEDGSAGWATDRLSGCNWAAAGALLVFVGSFMSFVSTPPFALYEVDPDVKSASATLGVVLGIVALAMRVRNSRMFCSGLMLCIAGLGTLGYGMFMILGLTGFDAEDDFGYTQHVEFQPGPGLIACVVGCAIAFVAAISAMATARD